MTTDQLDIPAFLRRKHGAGSVRMTDPAPRVGEIGADGFVTRWVDQPSSVSRSEFSYKPKGLTDAEWLEIEAARAATQSDKKAASFRKFRNKLDAKGAVPTDIHGRPLYTFALPEPKPGDVVVSGGKREPKSRHPIHKLSAAVDRLAADYEQHARPRTKGASDDLGAQVSARIGADPAKLKLFAKANGVWKDGDQNAKNPGLLRMTVVNRLRGRIKRGELKQPVWP